jgi:hypothetical protein
MHRPVANWKRARAALGWTVAGFVCAQIVLTLALEILRPDVNDPEFELRLSTLKQRHREDPARPLLLVVGSSRLVSSFQPEILPPLTAPSGAQVLPFNFAQCGAGPVLNLVEINRLLHKGVRPRWIVLEVMPPFLVSEGTSLLTTVTSTGDLPALHPLLDRGKLYGRYLRARVLPCIRYRSELCRLFLPAFATRPCDDPVHITELGGYQDVEQRGRPSSADIARLTASAQAQYFDPCQHFCINPAADGALRKTIELGQRHGVRFALLVTPEASTFRSWYGPGASALLNTYLAEVARRYQVPLIDARKWQPDGDFIDGHHLFGPAAASFSRRLAEEVFQPLVAEP